MNLSEVQNGYWAVHICYCMLNWVCFFSFQVQTMVLKVSVSAWGEWCERFPQREFFELHHPLSFEKYRKFWFYYGPTDDEIDKNIFGWPEAIKDCGGKGV